MAGCKRCALKTRKGEGKKKRKEKGNGGKKWESKSFLFISPRACFFHKCSGHFWIYKKNCF